MTTPSLLGSRDASASASGQEEFRDLGFGAEVARGTRRRLLNRDGSFNVALEGLDPLSSLSLYHWLLTISWPKFLAFISGTYVLQSASGSFANEPFYRAFFFSVDTFATIGYGNITPVGVLANSLVTIEALLNIVGVALATGVIFARFSRPSARIVYSRNAIIAPYQGAHALEFRIANARRSQLIEVQVQAILTKLERVGGTTVRKFHDLPLERNRVVFFPLSWTVVHPIDAASPMSGLTPADLVAANAELLVLLTGTDETVSQTVHSRSSYQAKEIIWGAKFANMFMRDEVEGIMGMDLNRIHDIEPVL
jgi:inward rectifier potassium channel